MSLPPTPSRRIPGAQRRGLVLEAAMDAFAAKGYEATTTADVAAHAGVSQPYVIRLFGTKRELFLAVVDRCFARVEDAFARAAAAAPTGEQMKAMGAAYLRLLERRRDLRLQLYTYAACDDPVIAAAVRSAYAHLVALVAELTGADPDSLLRFFAHGMLLNVVAATDLALEAPHAPALAAMLTAAGMHAPPAADAPAGRTGSA
jgi:AcrR family transcriptional regulator